MEFFQALAGRTVKRRSGEPLPSLLLRQLNFGIGMTVEERLCGRRAIVAKVEPKLGGVRARIFLRSRSGVAEVVEGEAWGGRWRIIENPKPTMENNK